MHILWKERSREVRSFVQMVAMNAWTLRNAGLALFSPGGATTETASMSLLLKIVSA